MKKRNHWITFCLIAVWTITACKALSFTPAATSTAPPTETPRTRATDSEVIPTQPSEIPSAAPTATPEGWFVSNGIGLSFIIPDSWVISDQTDTEFGMENEDGVSYFYATSAAESKEDSLPISELAQVIAESQFPDAKVEYSEAFVITLADGVIMDGMDMVFPDLNMTLRLMTTNTGMRSYIFFFISEQSNFEENTEDFLPTLQSLRFFTPTLFGMAAEDTLFLMGGDPEPIELDPAITYTSAQDYVGYLFSGLVRLSPQLQIEPDLAQEWSISSDGLVYTFVLRPNLKFASGKPITAQHFKDCWERAADPEIQSSTAATYLGDILGVKEKLAGDTDNISGIQVIDAYTLEVTLDGPKPYFLAKLTYPTAYVYDVSQAVADPEDWMWNPDASGPYTFKEYSESSHILFERNLNYHTPATITNVAFNLNPGGSPVSLYEEGLLDILAVGTETAERIRNPEDALNTEWQSTTSLCTMLIQVNNTIPPMDDAKVREAFALAIDRDIYVDRLTNNLDIPALSVLPPAMPGYTTESQAGTYNPEAARQALLESSYAGNLPSITINTSGFGDSERDDVAALIEMWRSVLDIEVQVEYLDPNQYTEAARQLHGQLVWYGWCADYPDPENFLDVLYHSESNFNVAGYTNTQLDTLLEQARVTLDPTSRLALYQQAEKLLLSDFGVIPVVHNVYDVLVKPRVEGFVLSPLHTIFINQLSLVNP